MPNIPLSDLVPSRIVRRQGAPLDTFTPTTNSTATTITPSASLTPTPNTQRSGSSAIISVAVAGGVFLVVGLIITLFICLKKSRIPKQSNQKDGFFSKFTRWRTRSNSNRGEYSDHLQPIISQPGNSRDNLSRLSSSEAHSNVEMELAQQINTAATSRTSPPAAAADSGVDRHASVRSIMTLPAYSSTAHPTEQVLGREGDRGGIDVVIEHPEGDNEEERRREEEMESLYQIRRARRAEAAEREDRRRQRREARARGDNVTLARLQAESRQRAAAVADGSNVSAQLIAEHQTKNRDRRISSVQYHDIGLARHDGSRVRNTSFDSDNRPLLSSAASISGSTRPGSLALTTHHRGASATSFASISSASSNGNTQDFEVISLSPTRSRSSSVGPRIESVSPPATQTQPQPQGDTQPPPPEYEQIGWGDAPPYEPQPQLQSSPPATSPSPSPAPISNAPPRLPRLSAVPAIEITAALSPEPSPRP